MEFLADIATAPGDLPLPAIQKRIERLGKQFRHDNRIAPLAPSPTDEVRVLATCGAAIRLTSATLYYTADGSAPEPEGSGTRCVAMEAVDVTWYPQTGYLTRWEGVIPAQTAGTAVRYAIVGREDNGRERYAHDGQGFWFRYEGAAGLTTFAYVVETKPPMPAWMRDAVIYHVFLDRFHPGGDGTFAEGHGTHEKHGGNLVGLMAALPYLANLGIDCLWISPVGPSESYHRYNATSYTAVDEDLGGETAVQAFIEAAHRLDMRVILDFVPSHLSHKHEAFLAAQRDANAPTADWFVFDEWPHLYRCFLDSSPALVSINPNSAGARQHLVESALHWVRAGVDGFRLDHAIGHGMDFWVQLRLALEAEKQGAVTIGEVTDTPNALRRYRGRLHGVLDFPLASALRLTFGTEAWDVGALDSFLNHYERYMSDGPGRVSFLDNHDMDRFLYVAGQEKARLKMAAVCQMSLAATPTIYYGTEIGLSQPLGMKEMGFGGDVLARAGMPWDEALWDNDLLAFYRQLIGVRRALLALRAGMRETAHVSVEEQTYGYVCKVADGLGDTAVVLFNLSREIRVIPLERLGAQVAISTKPNGAKEVNGGWELAGQTAVILRQPAR